MRKHGIDGTFSADHPFAVDARDSRLGREWNESRVQRRHIAGANVVSLLGEDDDGAALGGFVGEGSELRSIGEVSFAYARERKELRRLTIAERDRARLVQE